MSVYQAHSFLDAIAANLHSLYLAVGRSDASPWVVETEPPAPSDTLTDEVDFRQNIIGIKRIPSQQLALLVKEVPWEPDANFAPLDPTVAYPRRGVGYYCVTSENSVFECTYAPETPTQPDGEPSLKNDHVVTPDAYEWRYLFDINPQHLNNSMTVKGWIPVPYNMHGVFPGGSLTANQNSFGDNNANYTLGAWRVLVLGVLEDEGPAIPYYISFRQCGILIDPRDNSGDLLTGPVYANSQFDTDSGLLVYLENREVVYRAPDQTEQIKLILSF
jgi:hypothetical protein